MYPPHAHINAPLAHTYTHPHTHRTCLHTDPHALIHMNNTRPPSPSFSVWDPGVLECLLCPSSILASAGGQLRWLPHC